LNNAIQSRAACFHDLEPSSTSSELLETSGSQCTKTAQNIVVNTNGRRKWD
jgi:hypothetical protein